jgi:uncharacterized membrane protein
MTVLVVDLSVPVVAESRLDHALADEWPQFFSFGLSFLVIGVWWIGHHRMFQFIVRSDLGLVRLNVLFLFAIAFMPFPTALLGEYGKSRTAFVLYAADLAVASLLSAALWAYATHRGRLVRREVGDRLIRYLQIRPLCVSATFLTSIPIAFARIRIAELWWVSAVMLTGLARRRYRDVDRLF